MMAVSFKLRERERKVEPIEMRAELRNQETTVAPAIFTVDIAMDEAVDMAEGVAMDMAMEVSYGH